MFHQINELMVLGMHPAISHPRRSQIRPLGRRTFSLYALRTPCAGSGAGGPSSRLSTCTEVAHRDPQGVPVQNTASHQ